MTPRQMHKLLLKRRGAMSGIARRLDVKQYYVTLVLQGNKGGRVGRETAKRILEAANIVANEISDGMVEQVPGGASASR